jgi:hypothetical protein
MQNCIPLSSKAFLRSVGREKAGERERRWGKDVIGGGVVGKPRHRRFAIGERMAVGERHECESTSAGRGGGRAGGRSQAQRRVRSGAARRRPIPVDRWVRRGSRR